MAESEPDLYDLEITFRIKVKKWRIDDQTDKANREWSLKLYDRNKEEWVRVIDLDRPGEMAGIVSIVQK
jgi:hypothetical protein